MKKEFIYIAIFYIVTGSILYFISPVRDCLCKIYFDKKLQIPLFSGLLTVGTFLLTMKTFIIFKIKESLYDNPEYIKISQQSLMSCSEHYDHYKGLKELSDYLSISILGALLGSICNISIGFIYSPLSSIICISISVCTIVLLLYAWHLVWQNLRDWLNILENPANPIQASRDNKRDQSCRQHAGTVPVFHKNKS